MPETSFKLLSRFVLNVARLSAFVHCYILVFANLLKQLAYLMYFNVINDLYVHYNLILRSSA